MDAMQFTGVDSNVETMVNEGEIEGDQAVDFIIENSQNPVEVANQLQQTDKTIKGDTELEAPWEADFRLRSIGLRFDSVPQEFWLPLSKILVMMSIMSMLRGSERQYNAPIDL